MRTGSVLLVRLTTVSLLVIGSLACSPGPTPPPSVVTEAPTPTQNPDFSPPPGVPLAVTELARQLECDDPGQPIGAEIGQMAPAGGSGTASVYPWLETLGHCGWQSTTWLHVGNRLYIRDPLGVLAGQTVGPLLRNAVLPPDARSTGFRSGDRELFIGDTDLFVWIKTSQGVERWPKADAQLGCA